MERIVGFFTNPGRGLSVIAKLEEAGHEIAAVYVSEAASKDTSLRAYSGRSGASIELLPERLDDPEFVQAYRARNPRLALLLGFNRILPGDLVDLPELGTINLHGGLLPRYRGGSALNWQVLNGETRGGICVTRVTRGIDDGPVMAERWFDIGPDDDISTVHERANGLFPEMVLEVVTALDADTLLETSQDEAAAQYWHQRSDADGAIDFAHLSAKQVHDLVRALAPPYPGAHAALGSQTVRILKTAQAERVLRGTPGTVLYLQGEGPYVICRDRAIYVHDYKIEGGGKLRHRDRLTASHSR